MGWVGGGGVGSEQLSILGCATDDMTFFVYTWVANWHRLFLPTLSKLWCIDG